MKSLVFSGQTAWDIPRRSRWLNSTCNDGPARMAGLYLYMPIIAAIAGLAAIVWGAIYARRGSLVVGAALVLVAAYVVGHEFWHAKVGPVPVTLDRLVLGGLAGGCGRAVADGTTDSGSRSSAAIGCSSDSSRFLAVSAVLSGPPEICRGESTVSGRLLASFLLPALLYFIVRAGTDHAAGMDWDCWRACRCWAYICRSRRCARSPASGRSCFRGTSPIRIWAFISAGRVGRGLTRPVWVFISRPAYGVAGFCWADGAAGCNWLLLAALPLMALGVFFTYTRSTWIGPGGKRAGRRLVANAATLAIAGVRRGERRWACWLLAISWSAVVGLKREGYGGRGRAFGRSARIVRICFVADVQGSSALGRRLRAILRSRRCRIFRTGDRKSSWNRSGHSIITTHF